MTAMDYVMTATEQRVFDSLYASVERARDLLEAENAGAPNMPEDLRVACARLDNWLLENHGRYVR